MLIDILNGIIDVLTLIAGAVLSLLPDTPFDFSNLSWGDFGDLIGFLFPIEGMFAHMTVIIGAFLTYYVIRWILRIVRQIQ